MAFSPAPRLVAGMRMRMALLLHYLIITIAKGTFPMPGSGGNKIEQVDE
jgi:hypothetical protein